MSFRGEKAVVLMADGDARWELRLPALIRGQLVVGLSDLVEIEAAVPIQREEVTDR